STTSVTAISHCWAPQERRCQVRPYRQELPRTSRRHKIFFAASTKGHTSTPAASSTNSQFGGTGLVTFAEPVHRQPPRAAPSPHRCSYHGHVARPSFPSRSRREGSTDIPQPCPPVRRRSPREP